MFLETCVTVYCIYDNPPKIRGINGKIAEWTRNKDLEIYETKILLSHLGIFNTFNELNKDLKILKIHMNMYYIVIFCKEKS